MQRVIPIPDPMQPMPNASQLGIKILADGYLDIVPYFSDPTLSLLWYRNGQLVTTLFDPYPSGYTYSIPTLQAGDILIFQEALTRLDIQNDNVESIVLNSDLTQLTATACASLKCIDFRNASSFTSGAFPLNNIINTLYDTANMVSTFGAAVGIINGGTVVGTLYTDSAGTYYSYLETTALNKGWTIVQL